MAIMKHGSRGIRSLRKRAHAFQPGLALRKLFDSLQGTHSQRSTGFQGAVQVVRAAQRFLPQIPRAPRINQRPRLGLASGTENPNRVQSAIDGEKLVRQFVFVVEIEREEPLLAEHFPVERREGACFLHDPERLFQSILRRERLVIEVFATGFLLQRLVLREERGGLLERVTGDRTRRLGSTPPLSADQKSSGGQQHDP